MVAACLVDCVSIRATERITGAHRDTVMRFGVTLGEGCARLHDRLVRDLPCHLLQCDEAWTFVHTKEKRVEANDPREWGDQYVYIGLDVPSRMIVSYLIGKRDPEGAQRFALDLRGRRRAARRSAPTAGARTPKRSGRRTATPSTSGRS